MSKNFFSIILPGLLIAATGVGAGDLATAGFAGSQLGISILWAVVLGGVFKFALTEGIARWQLVQGKSFLDSLASSLGKPFVYIFLSYLVLWAFFVGSALISASGVALHAVFPVIEQELGKIIFGIFCSLLGLLIVRLGDFRVFEIVMSISIGMMFCIVVITALMLWPGYHAVISGLFVPQIPDINRSGLSWTVALIGGVGGTLTIFSYGYWIKEKQRMDRSQVSICRTDLLVGYGVTIVFGLSMVIIGSTVSVEGKGTGLILNLASSLETALGEAGRWLFLLGAFFAIFSSLLGVWQAVPYMFADVVKHLGVGSSKQTMPLDKTASYRWFQLSLAIIPILSLWMSFKEVQKLYSVVGTFFIPFLALALLFFNNKKSMERNKSGWGINGLLMLTLFFFMYIAWRKLS